MGSVRSFVRAVGTLAAGLLVAAAMSAAAFAQPEVPGETILFKSGNDLAVANGPTKQTTFKLDRRTTITSILDYHWNGGQGAPPGTIALIRIDDKKVFGPYQAVAQAGPAPVNWIVTLHLTVKPGSYVIADSDPNTWAQNEASGNCGMSIVRGYAAAIANATTSLPAPAVAATPTQSAPPAETATPSVPAVTLSDVSGANGTQALAFLQAGTEVLADARPGGAATKLAGAYGRLAPASLPEVKAVANDLYQAVDVRTKEGVALAAAQSAWSAAIAAAKKNDELAAREQLAVAYADLQIAQAMQAALNELAAKAKAAPPLRVSTEGRYSTASGSGTSSVSASPANNGGGHWERGAPSIVWPYGPPTDNDTGQKLGASPHAGDTWVSYDKYKHTLESLGENQYDFYSESVVDPVGFHSHAVSAWTLPPATLTPGQKFTMQITSGDASAGASCYEWEGTTTSNTHLAQPGPNQTVTAPPVTVPRGNTNGQFGFFCGGPANNWIYTYHWIGGSLGAQTASSANGAANCVPERVPPTAPSCHPDPEEIQLHVRNICSIQGGLGKDKSELANEHDAARRADLQLRVLGDEANLGAERDLIASLTSCTHVHTRTAYDDYAHDLFVQRIRESQAEMLAGIEARAKLEHLVALAPPSEQRTVQDFIDRHANTIDITQLRAAFKAVTDLVGGYYQKEAATEEERAVQWDDYMKRAENVQAITDYVESVGPYKYTYALAQSLISGDPDAIKKSLFAYQMSYVGWLYGSSQNFGPAWETAIKVSSKLATGGPSAAISEASQAYSPWLASGVEFMRGYPKGGFWGATADAAKPFLKDSFKPFASDNPFIR